jgi:GNAT superfamily N-acetyltransferase
MTVIDFPAPTTSTHPARATARSRHRGSPPTPTLRELGPGETDVLDAVFAGLSAHSRYLRFHGATPRMTGTVRRKLAAVEGRRHLAVAAFAPDGAPIGIARLIWLGLRDVELAIEVVDAWQGRGVGRRLLTAVASRGRVEGYTRLVAVVLAENVGVRVLLVSALPILTIETSGHEVTLTADLRPATPIAAVA